MRNFQKRGRYGSLIYSKPVLILLGILVLVFIWWLFGFMAKMRSTIENKKIAENKVAELEQEKAKLSSDIAKLKTDQGVEESVRQKFGLAKDGEGEVVVVEDKNTSAVQQVPVGGFFSSLFFWKNWFK